MGCSSTKMVGIVNNERPDAKGNNSFCTIGMEKLYQMYDAIKSKTFEDARQLISDGMDVNCLNYIGGTPLIETCRHRKTSRKDSRRESFVRFMIEHGADISRNDIFGCNAQIYAKENGHIEIARLLEDTASMMLKTENIGNEEQNMMMTIDHKIILKDDLHL